MRTKDIWHAQCSRLRLTRRAMWLKQFQADILNREVVRPIVQETTALGAAYAAGLAVGFYSDVEELRDKWKSDRIWKPEMGQADRDRLYRGWKKAVSRSFDWMEN